MHGYSVSCRACLAILLLVGGALTDQKDLSQLIDGDAKEIHVSTNRFHGGSAYDITLQACKVRPTALMGG